MNDKNIRPIYLTLLPGAQKKTFGYRVAHREYLLTSFPGQKHIFLKNR